MRECHDGGAEGHGPGAPCDPLGAVGGRSAPEITRQNNDKGADIVTANYKTGEGTAESELEFQGGHHTADVADRLARLYQGEKAEKQREESAGGQALQARRNPAAVPTGSGLGLVLILQWGLAPLSH